MLTMRNMRTVLIGMIVVTTVGCGSVEESDSKDLSTNAGRDIPAHLLQAAEVEALSKKLVEPFARAEGLGEEDLSTMKMGSIGSLISFASDSLNTAMRLPSLAPGRSFKVYVLDSILLNAMADGDQQIMITAPFLMNSKLTANQLLAVLCHEMAHSARNHAAKSSANTDQNSGGSEALSEYLKISWDGLLYTHNKAAFEAMIAKLKAARSSKALTLAKHDESEADVLGGMLCGEMGMDVETYAEGFRNLDALLDPAQIKRPYDAPPSQLPDGAKFSITAFDLVDYLRSDMDDDHPNSKERIDQIMRYKSQIAAHYQSNQTFARQWSQSMPGLLTQARSELVERWRADDLLRETSPMRNRPVSYTPVPIPIRAPDEVP